MYIGQKARHKEVYNGKETLEIVGIRADTVELKGDFSGGTHNVEQVGWFPKKGLILQNVWGAFIDPETAIDFTKGAGPRDL
jgi:hypothetical protein